MWGRRSERGGEAYGHVDFAEHGDAFDGVFEGDVLGGGDYYCACVRELVSWIFGEVLTVGAGGKVVEWVIMRRVRKEGGKSKELETVKFHLLRDGQLRVARPRREVQDQHVQPSPLDLVEQLLQGLHDHQPAPHDGRLLADEKAHGHCFDAVVC